MRLQYYQLSQSTKSIKTNHDLITIIFQREILLLSAIFTILPMYACLLLSGPRQVTSTSSPASNPPLKAHLLLGITENDLSDLK